MVRKDKESSPHHINPDALKETAAHLVELANREPDNPVASEENQQIIQELIDGQIDKQKK